MIRYIYRYLSEWFVFPSFLYPFYPALRAGNQLPTGTCDVDLQLAKNKVRNHGSIAHTLTLSTMTAERSLCCQLVSRPLSRSLARLLSDWFVVLPAHTTGEGQRTRSKIYFLLAKNRGTPHLRVRIGMKTHSGGLCQL